MAVLAKAIRFFLDEDISCVVAELARALGLDVTSAQELNRHAYVDEAQLLFAAGERRCLVSKNAKDYRGLTLDHPAPEAQP